MALTTIPVPEVSTNSAMNEQRFTSSGTWTAPTGVTKVWLQMVGGGGGGRSGAGGQYNGHLGATGEIINQQVTVVPGTTYTATIGAGGASTNSTGAGAANAGNDTTIFSLTATGGYAGKNSPFLTAYTTIRSPGAPTIAGRGAEANQGQSAPANSGAGGQPSLNSSNSGSGGSGLIIIKWLQ